MVLPLRDALVSLYAVTIALRDAVSTLRAVVVLQLLYVHQLTKHFRYVSLATRPQRRLFSKWRLGT